MTIDEMLEILEHYKLRMPPTTYYELQADIVNFEEPTTKNDLGVDCISRADAIKAMEDKAKKLTNEDTINGLCGAVAILYELPPVTPQEPRKGHWILRGVEGVGRVWSCKCSQCGKDPQYYISGTEDWWLTKSNLPNYCPHCGSDNREVEE